MTLRDLLDQITLEGWHKILCWEDTDNPNIYIDLQVPRIQQST